MSVIEALPEKPVDLRPLGPSDLCYIQFSSGSTRQPHGVQITQAALMANLAGITGPAGLDVVPGDRAVSWLPLYHDMGLIGFLMAPLSTQLSLDYLTPRDFARRPTQWLNLMSRQSRHHRLQPELRLRPRHAARRRPGAGRSRPVVLAPCRHRRRHDPRPTCSTASPTTFEPAGFDRKAFIPSYGMAEVYARHHLQPNGSRAHRRVDATLTAERRRPVHGPAQRRRRFVLCGKVLPGHRLEVRDEAGKVLGDREVGRIFVHGPQHHGRATSASPRPRARCWPDGWLDTGDLGYTLEGEVVVTGRAKDLIIVNGRNIWPQDIEWAIETRRVVKNGDSVAFSVDGADGERVVVAVLARVSGEEGRKTLASDVAQAVREAIAVDCDVVLVPPSMGLPTTSSGKLSRSRAKANYLAGLYAPKTAAA